VTSTEKQTSVIGTIFPGVLL